MTEKIKSPRVLCAAALLALFAVQMLMHMNVDNLLLDDWVFYAVLEAGESIPAWLAARWATWSSRLLIEGVLCVITHSIWAFRVLDSAVMVLMAWALCRLAGSEKRPGMLALSSLLVTTIPFAVLRSTGWMATSLNYYWPLTAALFALIPLADALWKRRTGGAVAAIAVTCAFFGANQEQTSAVIAGSCLVLGAALMIRDRRISPVIPAVFVIAAAQLTLHLLCPGNALRAEQSVAIVNLRDYGQFSFVDKLSIGLTSTTALLFFTYCPMLLACGAAVSCTALARRRGTAAVMMTALAPGFMLALHLLGNAQLPQALLRYGSYVLQLGPERIQQGGQLAVMFLIVSLLGMMALSLYLSIGHRPLAACTVFAFAVGFAARMALSFSPTVVESGERTMLPLYGAMMLCTLLCVRDCEAEGARRWSVRLAYAACAVIAAMNIASSFALAA